MYVFYGEKITNKNNKAKIILWNLSSLKKNKDILINYRNLLFYKKKMKNLKDLLEGEKTRNNIR
jgi:hypothetical protein